MGVPYPLRRPVSCVNVVCHPWTRHDVRASCIFASRHPDSALNLSVSHTVKTKARQYPCNAMAGATPPDSQEPRASELSAYRDCLITPMDTDADGRPFFRAKHLVDAVLVSLVVLFSVILGDVMFAWASGVPAYLTLQDIINRLPTAFLSFGLTFTAQWARARGIRLKAVLLGQNTFNSDNEDGRNDD